MAEEESEAVKVEGEMTSEPFTLIEEVGSGKGVMDKIRAGREWINTKRATVKPWSEFVNVQKMSRPKNGAEATKRLIHNIYYFQSNYIFVSLALVAYSILSNPMLLFAIMFCLVGWWFMSIRNHGQSVTLFGREFNPQGYYTIMVLIAVPLFYFASAGSTVFWIIGASIFVIVIHAILHTVTQEVDEGEIEVTMEEVVSQVNMNYSHNQFYSFVSYGQIIDMFICKICHYVSADPQETLCCTNTCCKSCIDKAKKSGKMSCPVCGRQPYYIIKATQIDRQIKLLEIFCKNNNQGCPWIGTLESHDIHLSECEFETVPCEYHIVGCDVRVKRIDQQQLANSELGHKVIRQQLEYSNRELKDMQQQLNKRNKKINDYEKILNVLRKKLENTQAKLASSKYTVMKEELNKRDKKINDYEEDINFFKKKLKDYEENINFLRKKLEDTEAKLARSNECTRRLIFYVCLFIGTIISWLISKTYS